jgi:hypothetical protein
MALENQDRLPEISLMNDSHTAKHSFMTPKELLNVQFIRFPYDIKVTTKWTQHLQTNVGVTDKDFKLLNKSALKEKATTASVTVLSLPSLEIILISCQV